MRAPLLDPAKRLTNFYTCLIIVTFTDTNLILPHICHFYDDEIISWEPPYWIRPNIWPSSTHASYLSLFRWGQNKERLFQCIGCSPQRLTIIFIGLWHTYKSKTSGQSIYRFHQNHAQISAVLYSESITTTITTTKLDHVNFGENPHCGFSAGRGRVMQLSPST